MNKKLLNAICTPLLLLALTACTNNEEVNNVQDMPQSYTYDIDITVGNDNNSATPNSAKGGCVKMYTSSFYAQSPDFLKPGLCYFLKFLYL